MLDMARRWLRMFLSASTAKYEHDHGDDHDYAEYANPAAHTVVRISVITSPKTAEQDQQNDNDQDSVQDISLRGMTIK